MARAQPASRSFERVSELVDSADFDGAEKAAELELRSGELSRSLLGRVYLELGVIASARGANAAAEASFRKALTLDGSLALRDSAGPHVADAFERARGVVQARPPLHAQAGFRRGKTPAEIIVTAKVTNDPEHVAHAIALDVEGARATGPLLPDGTPFVHRVESAAERCVTVVASIVDQHGNSVWPSVARETLCPPTAAATHVVPPPHTAESEEPSPSKTPAPVSERPIPAHVWIGAGLTGALAVVTTVLGIRALDAGDTYEQANGDPNASVAERSDLEEKAQAAQRSATIAGVATGVVGSATLVLFFTRPSSESGARVTAGVRRIAVSFDF